MQLHWTSTFISLTHKCTSKNASNILPVDRSEGNGSDGWFAQCHLAATVGQQKRVKSHRKGLSVMTGRTATEVRRHREDNVKIEWWSLYHPIDDCVFYCLTLLQMK
jgi:hypothetical protein